MKKLIIMFLIIMSSLEVSLSAQADEQEDAAERTAQDIMMMGSKPRFETR